MGVERTWMVVDITKCYKNYGIGWTGATKSTTPTTTKRGMLRTFQEEDNTMKLSNQKNGSIQQRQIEKKRGRKR